MQADAGSHSRGVDAVADTIKGSESHSRCVELIVCWAAALQRPIYDAALRVATGPPAAFDYMPAEEAIGGRFPNPLRPSFAGIRHGMV